MAVYRVQDTSLTAVADAIRAKAGTSDALTFPDGFVEAVGGIQAGGGGSGGVAGVSPKEVNFYDYDGTLLHAYTVAEAQALSALPDGPQHPGLVFQGWNWSLEGVKRQTRAMNIGAMYITDDGTTRLYITLQEGRTSPMLGICVNGTVTVDWGDGTEPDTLTGTSTTTPVWTETHTYAAPGDYVIRLTVAQGGSFTFGGANANNVYAYVLRHTSNADARNHAYQNALKRIEIGNRVYSLDAFAFQNCYSLASVTIPDSVTSIGSSAFATCYGMAFYDFTACTAVPTLSNSNAFSGIPADCEIRVPAVLYDEWVASTNWATHADKIKAY